MKINYTCYSIRKFFLIFLAITCQVGIINAGDILSDYETYLKLRSLEKLLNLLQNKDNKKLIKHDTATFINEIKTSLFNETAFQLAFSRLSETSSKPLIKELLKFQQLDVNQIINPEKNKKEQQTGLVCSITKNEYDLAKDIINHPKFDLSKQIRPGIGILIDIINLASDDENVQKKQLALVKLLIEKKNTKGQTIINFNKKWTFDNKIHYLKDITFLMYTIHWFCNKRDFRVTDNKKEFLLKVIPLLIQSSDMAVISGNNGHTALITAINYYEENSNDQYKKKFQEQILPLMLKPEYVNQQGGYGQTPIIPAVAQKKKTLVKKLLAVKKINVDIQDSNNQTAIFYAIKNYDKDIFEQILNATKDLNHQDSSHQTPLFTLINKEFDDQAAHQDAIKKLAKKLEESSINKSQSDIDYTANDNQITPLHYLVLAHIIALKKIKEDEKNKIQSLEQQKISNTIVDKDECNKQIDKVKELIKSQKQKLNEEYIPKINILVDAGADPTLTFQDPRDSQEKTAITLITDDLVQEHEELGNLKSSLEEAKENYKKRKDKNKDTSTQDQDPSQNQDEGNGMNIGTVVIIIAAVGSLVVGAIVAVPLLFKKQKATKENDKSSVIPKESTNLAEKTYTKRSKRKPT